MKDEGQHSEPAPTGEDRGVAPETGGADRRASELVVSALLSMLHGRDHSARQRRIERVLAAVDRESGRTGRPLLPQIARWSLAVAAMVLIGTVVVIMGVPGESTALAEMNQTIAALRQPGDRRYEVRLMSWEETEPRKDLGAVIDMRSPDLLLVQHWPPGSERTVCVGRDGLGAWAIGDDGAISRDSPYRAWPPWSADGETLFVDSMDRLLSQLPKRYTLKTVAAEAVADSGSTALFARISASRVDRAGPFPHRVEIWIDPVTRLTERVEFRWDQPGAGGGGRGGGPGRGPGSGRRPHTHDHDDRPPPPPPTSGGFGRDRPPGPPGRPEPDDLGDDRRFGSGPPPIHTHGDRPDGPHGKPELGGPGGHVMEPKDGRRGCPPPGGGLKLIAFQRVDPPPLDPAWFSAEHHVGR